MLASIDILQGSTAMNSIRKWVCFIIGIGIVAFASPGMAAKVNKHFSLGMAVGASSVPQQDTVIIATITNDNPSGSSAQFSSFTLSVANTSGIVITSVELDPAFGGDVAVQNATSVSITDLSPVKATQSYSLILHVAGCGDLNTWSAVVWSGNNFSGATYFDDSPPKQNITNVPCGTLACGDAITGATVSSLIDTVTQGVQQKNSSRGPYNQDGTCSSASLSYFVTQLFSPANNEYLHFRWTSEPSAVFFYILNQPSTNPPLLSWKTIGDDITGTPVFVLGQTCDQGVNVKFPARYGTLVSDGGGRNIKVDITTAINTPLPAVPFRIAIGPKSIEEFMTVTRVSGQTWTVTRGPNSNVHSAGTDVMSTPVPALVAPVCYDNTGTPLNSCPHGTYVAGDPALMCVVPNADTTRTYLFDIGDGWVLGR